MEIRDNHLAWKFRKIYEKKSSYVQLGIQIIFYKTSIIVFHSITHKTFTFWVSTKLIKWINYDNTKIHCTEFWYSYRGKRNTKFIWFTFIYKHVYICKNVQMCLIKKLLRTEIRFYYDYLAFTFICLWGKLAEELKAIE